MPFPGEHYGPELLRIVKHAREDACAELRFAGRDDGRIPRLMMSIRLMAAVATGERDPERLKVLALNSVDASASAGNGGS